ncbi:hypothetical protein [Streptomyces sp. YPW6]|uniref:hypothetical protein n=1 Tax=Streptomyces sp. YPW6 TaxID=2840373 RepID=UPI003EBD9672
MDRNQPQPVELTDPLIPVVPRPYPRCAVCKALNDEWITLTEPASVHYDRFRAADVAREINEHRRKDEAKAPAL